MPVSWTRARRLIPGEGVMTAVMEAALGLPATAQLVRATRRVPTRPIPTAPADGQLIVPEPLRRTA